mmetsp:Transcript_2066/g.2030  ORF Transcript_2066/g.2030 Transcript_2066/m.2030 type:complete len:278 (-) Transcript_2066:125-958(-)
MIFSYFLFISLFKVLLSYSNSSGCNITYGSCIVNSINGECVSKSAGCCQGILTSGYCPGSSDIQCCTIQTINGVLGLDIADPASVSDINCFISSGYKDFIVPRGFRSTGAIDTNVCTNLKNAQTAGIKYRDVYMFPCPTCSTSASSQLTSLVNYLNTNCASAWSGRVWLDIEGSNYWYTSTSTNKAWYQELVDSCTTNKIRCGVYSSSSQWSSIFGSTSYSYGASNPLWYAHYDNLPAFSDFVSFGGWKTPYAKQYAGDETICGGFDVDKDYAPLWD